MPRPTFPITRDRKILYRNPKTLTIKLDINKIRVDKTKLGILKKNHLHILKMYSYEGEKIIIIL